MVVQRRMPEIPSIREEVEREERIRISYYDRDWNFHDEVFTGIKARVIQHEYDHLEGILFVDKINPLRRRLISGKLKAISKGKMDTDYMIVTPNNALVDPNPLRIYSRYYYLVFAKTR